MKQHIMKKWIKALRSGKYKQGKGTLKQYNRNGQVQHCCLGILCELYNEEMKKNKKKTLSEEVINNSDFPHGSTIFDRDRSFLPDKVMKWSGIKTCNGQLQHTITSNTYFTETLAEHNDNGVKFKAISDTIEKNWEVL